MTPNTTQRDFLAHMIRIVLQWEPEAKPDASCCYDHTSAATPFGSYRIEWKSWKDYPSFYVEFEGRFITVADTLSDAKTTAESNFNAKLNAALQGVETPAK